MSIAIFDETYWFMREDSEDKKINIENNTEYIFILVGLLGMSKYIGLEVLYHKFNLNILDYMTYNDIVSLVIPDATLIVQLILVIVMGYNFRLSIITKQSADVKLTYQPGSKLAFIKSKILPYLLLSIVIIILLLILAVHTLNFILAFFFGIFSLMGFIYTLLKLLERAKISLSGRLMAMIIFVLINFSYGIASSTAKAEDIKQSTQKVTFVYNGRLYETGTRSLKYISQTKTTLFLFNTVENKTLVFKRDQITNLEFYEYFPFTPKWLQ